MKRVLLLLISNLVLISLLFAQEEVKVKQETENPESISESIFNDESQKKLHFGGYGQIDYNQPIGGDFRENGKLYVLSAVIVEITEL